LRASLSIPEPVVTEYIRYLIPDGQAEAFTRAYTEAQRPLSASPHCLAYDLQRCVEEPGRFVLRITWDSLDGHMRGFRGSEEFRAFLGHIRPFVGMIEEMQHYQGIGIASEP
jgi:quinol monooxygenase YgiN